MEKALHYKVLMLGLGKPVDSQSTVSFFFFSYIYLEIFKAIFVLV